MRDQENAMSVQVLGGFSSISRKKKGHVSPLSSPFYLSSDFPTSLDAAAGAATAPGMRTESMMWMMPFEASTSVATTFALLT